MRSKAEWSTSFVHAISEMEKRAAESRKAASLPVERNSNTNEEKQMMIVRNMEDEAQSAVVPFNFEGNQIRVVQDSAGEPWFVAKDVCDVLGYVNGSREIQRHCKYSKLFKGTETVGMEIPPRGINIIPESDLYRLILRSNMPDAKRFQDWVTETVLPAIRKTGGYIAGEEHMDEDELILAAMQVLQRKVEEQSRLLEAQEHKVHAYDTFLADDRGYTVSKVSKFFADVRRVPLGRDRLFDMLKEWQWLISSKEPYQRYVDRGYFRLVPNRFGGQVMILSKGILAIMKKLQSLGMLKEVVAPPANCPMLD